MKKLALFVLLALLSACESKESPDIKPPTAAPETPADSNDSGAEGNPYYIEDGIEDPIYWVTNEYMHDFMAKVTYRDRDYTISRIKDFPGGGPGVADIPPAVNLKWENNFPDKKLLLQPAGRKRGRILFRIPVLFRNYCKMPYYVSP